MKTLDDWLKLLPLDQLPARNFNYQPGSAALAANLEPLRKEVTATAYRLDGGYPFPRLGRMDLPAEANCSNETMNHLS